MPKRKSVHHKATVTKSRQSLTLTAKSVIAKLPSFERKKTLDTTVKRRWFRNRKVIDIGISGLVIVSLIVAILLPLANVQASETLNWSKNADFSMNKAGTCGPTQTTNLVVSGNAYTDATCVAGDAESNISLKRDKYQVKDVVSMGAGYDHTVVAKTDGTVWAWGSNHSNQLGDGTTTVRNIPIQVKGADGVGFLTDVKSVSSGMYYSIAVKNDGTVWGWGANNYGKLGDGTTTARVYPVQVKGLNGTGFLTNVKSVVASMYHSMAVKNDGTVWGWGYNQYGQLADGTSTDRSTPVQAKIDGVTYLTNVKMVALGAYHMIALKNDGTVWGAGYNSNGALGTGSSFSPQVATQIPGANGTGYTTLAAADQNTLGVKNDGTVWAWGVGNSGQLGVGDNATVNLSPRQVKSPSGEGFLTDAFSVAAVSGTSFVVKNDGTVFGFGVNNYGQLGDNSTNSTILPVQVKGLDAVGFLGGIKTVVPGSNFVTALDENGTVWAWAGPNSNNGVLGLRSNESTLTPNIVVSKVETPLATGYKKVVTGNSYTLGLKSDGTVWGWGENTYGQIGDGTTVNTGKIVQVVNADGTGFLTDVKDISASTEGYTSVAIKNDGTVWSWGRNDSGQIGNGGYSNMYRPTQVAGTGGANFLSDIASVSVGGKHVLAVKNDGTVWSWGLNSDGQLGVDIGYYVSPTPVQVAGVNGVGTLSDVKTVDAGETHSLALKNDGSLLAWGLNGLNQLGDGTTTTRINPVQVLNEGGVTAFSDGVSIAAGPNYSIVAKSDGTVWGFGSNSNTQLGDGTSTQRAYPTQTKNANGSGFLTGIEKVEAGYYRTFAVATDGTAWGWGYGANGQIGSGGAESPSLPVRVVDITGTGVLSGIVSISPGYYHTAAVKSDGSVLIWGGPNSRNMGYDLSGNESQSYFPRVMLADFALNAGYSTLGTASKYIIDAGVGRKYQWSEINWGSTSLPVNTKITFSARTSNDGTTWSAWTSDLAQTTVGSTTGTGDISSLPLARFIELRSKLSTSDQVSTPTLNDFSVTYVNDEITPTENATAIAMKKTQTGAPVASNAWTNAATPYFSWAAGSDDGGGLGLLGYCLYLGQDASADVKQAKGILGDSPVATDGACQYIVSSTSLNTATQALATQLTTSDQPYHLLVKAIDRAGNLFDGDAESFSFHFDNTPPTTPSFISAPSQFIATKDATLTWPTTGAQAAADTNSGLAGLQYKIGTNGTWYGESHNGAQDLTDVLANDGSYQTKEDYDYPLLNEGNNIVYFRTIDNAGNVSVTNNTAAIKINTTSPTPPQNLTATPTTSTTNSFAFAWQAPSSFVGPGNALTYCYTVNTLPTDITCTFTPAGQTSLAADAFATQPGTNTLYVVARDEAGNVNYDTYATVEFTANTPAPGIPIGTEIADISTKATQTWKLALSWAAPGNVGAGVSKYAIYRSTNGTTFSQVATTSGLSYVDSSLDQQMYYYKIRACDSANNCGAYSDVFSRTPTGRFTSPPELVTSPSVQVSTKKASFSYVTDRESDSRIQYGTKSGEYFPGEIAVSASTKNHKVEISNLDAGTTYFYKAKWTDEDGNTGTSTELSFTTLPAPSIKNVSVIKQTLSSATIQFTSVDASQVNIYYGKSEGFGGLEKINTSRSESTYTVELGGLDDGSTYLYKFSTFDSDGNEYDSRRADSFTTPQRPRISELRFQPVTGEPTSTQKVTWKTNVPTNSTVSYGKIGDATKDIYDATVKTDHEVLIKNLEDASEYSLLAQSRDTSGNLATSDRQTFRTALDTRPPKISDIQIESLVKGNGSEARGQIVVSWKTDEPATSQIAYAQGSTGSTYASQTAEDGRLTTEHVVIVSDLAISSVYHLQPISRDKSANVAKGDDKSAIIGRATDSVLNIILSTLNRIFGL